MEAGERWKYYLAKIKSLIGQRQKSPTPETEFITTDGHNKTFLINKSISARRLFLKQGLLKFIGAVAVLTFPRQILAELNSKNTKKSTEQFPEDLLYHKRSMLTPGGVGGVGEFPSAPPPQYKTYPKAKKVALPELSDKDLTEVERVIRRRRSIRHYSQAKMTLPELSRVLKSAGAITEKSRGFRSAPSAGATYPIEIYCVVNNVDGLEQGIYHYEIKTQDLALIKSGDFSSKIMQSALYQSFVGKANAVIVLTAIFDRTRWRYKERAYRYILIEAGHIGENIYLAATALGLAPCAVGAFMDTKLNELLGLNDWREQALYILTVGK